jgi:predicted acyltransferase
MSPPNDRSPAADPAGRLVSLDAFRGLTIAGMILVNNPGTWAHVYAPLRHAEWHGWTPTDLVFPSFLFIVGVAIPLALGKRLERGDPPASVMAKVVRRTLVIVALGLLMNAFPFDKPLASLRIPGVLQRIGLCYLAAALIDLKTGVRTQCLVVAGLLLGYWAALTFVPVPGVGAGDLSRPNNLAAWVDRGVMSGHLYKSDYDPEGLLSTLPAIATTLIGVLAGRWLTTHRPIGERVAGLFAAGAVSLFAGSVWGTAFPINKALWTSSFVLLTAGLSLQVFGLCAWLIEVEGYRRWAAPLVVFGSNPIAAYVLSGLLARVLSLVTLAGPSGQATTLRALLYQHGFASWADPTFASLLWGLSYVLFWLAVMTVFYRFKLFIRV